jgi:hypothetical protein
VRPRWTSSPVRTRRTDCVAGDVGTLPRLVHFPEAALAAGNLGFRRPPPAPRRHAALLRLRRIRRQQASGGIHGIAPHDRPVQPGVPGTAVRVGDRLPGRGRGAQRQCRAGVCHTTVPGTPRARAVSGVTLAAADTVERCFTQTRKHAADAPAWFAACPAPAASISWVLPPGPPRLSSNWRPPGSGPVTGRRKVGANAGDRAPGHSPRRRGLSTARSPTCCTCRAAAMHLYWIFPSLASAPAPN